MDKIRCGVIGVGGIGSHHAKFIRESDLGELVAICDINQQVLREMAEHFQVERSYTDFRNIIADQSLDMVSICLPHYLHAPVSVEAMRAKKHVLTEKPIAINLDEADEMIRTARENNVQLGVAEEHRYAGQIQLSKKWIEEGKLGKLYLCSCTERFGSWEPNPWGWRSKKKMIGGGSYIDQGHHAVDLVRYIMGDPYECCAYMSRPTKVLEGEDVTLAIFKHEDDKLSQVHAGWAPGPTRFKMSIYGLKGTILVDNIRGRGTVSLFGPTEDRSEEPIEKNEKAWRWSKYIAIEKFLEAVAKDEPFEYDGEEGKKNLAAILAAYESVERGKSIRIRYN